MAMITFRTCNGKEVIVENTTDTIIITDLERGEIVEVCGILRVVKAIYELQDRVFLALPVGSIDWLSNIDSIDVIFKD